MGTLLIWSFQIRATLPTPHSLVPPHITQTIQAVPLLGTLSCLLSEFKSPLQATSQKLQR